MLLVKVEEILRDNERHVLALAHALETHKTLSGEDVTAVFEGGQRPARGRRAVRGRRVHRQGCATYHLAAKRAHREHNQPQLPLPAAEPAYAVADC